jgi:hypothetical protein
VQRGAQRSPSCEQRSDARWKGDTGANRGGGGLDERLRQRSIGIASVRILLVSFHQHVAVLAHAGP